MNSDISPSERFRWQMPITEQPLRADEPGAATERAVQPG